jgi:hypothetical protein
MNIPPEPNSQNKPRYIIRDAAYALEIHKPLDCIIDKIITSGSFSCFYGSPGSKKTYSLISMAVCAAANKDWLDFKIKGPLKVLFLDEENGEVEFTKRLGDALRGELAGSDTSIQFISFAAFKMDDKNDITTLQRLIEELGVQLVIIDSLSQIMDGDENSKQDTQPVLNALRRIADKTGAAIILIHHANKQGGFRGTTAISGSVDLLVKVESEPNSNWISFKTEKNRKGPPLAWKAVATWTDDQFYLSVVEDQKHENPYSQSQQYVIDFLTEFGTSPLSAITSGADSCSPNSAKHAVYDLVRKKIIRRTNPDEKGQGVGAIYEIITHE